MAPLIHPHERALMLLFAELESSAAEQVEAFLGTPGTIGERTNATGVRFWVHRFSDALGKRTEVYLGTRDDSAVGKRLAALRDQIAAANAAIARVRILARAGFSTVNRKTYATLATLHNHGLFRAGALLIGSHAYGALLNALGVRAVAYATEDVDIARREALAISRVPPCARSGAPRALDLEGPGGVLHAKAVVADEEVVFVTSANLTEAALDRNIELGLMLRDRALALSISSHFQGLIERSVLTPLPSA